jgi:hypothetical protein
MEGEGARAFQDDPALAPGAPRGFPAGLFGPGGLGGLGAGDAPAEDAGVAPPISFPFVPNPATQLGETERFVAYNSGFNAGYVRGYYVAVNNMNHRAGQRLHQRYEGRGRGRGRGGPIGGGWRGGAPSGGDGAAPSE